MASALILAIKSGMSSQLIKAWRGLFPSMRYIRPVKSNVRFMTHSTSMESVEQRAKAAMRMIDSEMFGKNKAKTKVHLQTRLFLKMYRGMIAFREIHGHLRIPLRYVIPDGEGFPTDLVGYKLGSLFAAIRSRAHWMHHPYKTVLIDLGIVPMECKELHWYTAPDVDLALQTYKSTNGNLDIPLDFIVTDDIAHQYKPYFKGAPLGKILDQIKQRRLHFTCTDVRERWRKLGIKFSRFDSVPKNANDDVLTIPGVQNAIGKLSIHNIADDDSSMKSNENEVNSNSNRSAPNFHKFLEAVLYHKEIFNHTNISLVCKLRKEDGFPEHLDGYNLGRKLNYIRSSASWMRGAYKEKLIELGLVPPESEEHRRKYSATDIERSLEVYAARYGNLVIPQDFVIVQNFVDEPMFPANMIGAPLGHLLELIKTRRLHFNPTDVSARWRKLNINFEKRKPLLPSKVTKRHDTIEGGSC